MHIDLCVMSFVLLEDGDRTHRTTADLRTLQPVPSPLCSAKIILIADLDSVASGGDQLTHICNEHHSTVGNQVKERLNFSMFFEKSPYVFTASFIL